MPRYRPQTIEEQGGLVIYLPKIGVDYTEFKRLKSTPGITKKALRTLLQGAQKKPWSRDAIDNWWTEDDKEIERQKHAKN